jgi:transposase
VDAAIRARYDGHLAQGHAANPSPPGRGAARSKAANLLARLDRHRDDVLRFTIDFRVPFDNNQAERDLRMAKLQQKISGCWRTLAGAETFCAVRSYISTARKQGVPASSTSCTPPSPAGPGCPHEPTQPRCPPPPEVR